MFYVHQTEKWLEKAVALINEKQLNPRDSRFMIGLFSSMDNEFVDYFKNNKDRISSVSGQNFHIFTPLIYEDNLIPDKEWRTIKNEFKLMGIPIDTDPTFIFFSLDNANGQEYQPIFFAGFKVSSFSNFPNKLKITIENCIEIKDTQLLSQKLLEVFLTKNIISNNEIGKELKQVISNKIPKSKLFISHSSIDKPFAHKLIKELSADTLLNFWIDETEILVGNDIQQSITKNLKSSDYLLIIISENSVNSKWVNFEIAQFMGLSGNQNIIPIVISKEQHFPEPIDNLIRKLKYLDFTLDDKWDMNIEELKQVLSKKTAIPIDNNINTHNNININKNINHINVIVPESHKQPVEKKPHWLIKAIVLAIIGIAVTLIVFFVENSGQHGQPTHNDKPAILPDK